jgi:hypothetical protein
MDLGSFCYSSSLYFKSQGVAQTLKNTLLESHGG